MVIVAGACGIAAGTPLAILGAIGRAAQRGVIVKGGRALEVLARVDVAVLDKTGTLTRGSPLLTAVQPVVGIREDDLLAAAAVAEARSEHPFAQPIRRAARERALSVAPPDVFAYTPGQGIVCRAAAAEIVVGSRALLRRHGIPIIEYGGSDHASEIFVARDARMLGTLRFEDPVRLEARAAIDGLHALGITTALLTGDGAAAATAVGRTLGIDRIEAEMVPEEKLRRIDALRAEGRTVMMVGDGVNDAPALTRAHVGVAMGSGTDVARETANVMLLGNDLLALVDALRIARRCHRIIMVNFVGTLAVDGAGMVLAAVGLLDPVLAAFVHVSSELLFILNSARLLRRGRAADSRARA